jgi:pimeloyl-ACP methyl ester carboxylesterase
MIRRKASVVTQKPAGTRMPSIRESSPRCAPLPPTTATCVWSISRDPARMCSRATPIPAFAASAESLRRGGPLDVQGSLGRWFLPDELAADSPMVRFARSCVTGADRARWADGLQAITGYDRTADLGRIEVPTRVIAADLDRAGTPDEMQTLAAATPGAEFVLVPQASHMSQFLSPAALAERIARSPIAPR